MAIPHAKPGEVIQLPLGTALGSSKTTTLVKTADLELIRLRTPPLRHHLSEVSNADGMSLRCRASRLEPSLERTGSPCLV